MPAPALPAPTTPASGSDPSASASQRSVRVLHVRVPGAGAARAALRSALAGRSWSAGPWRARVAAVGRAPEVYLTMLLVVSIALPFIGIARSGSDPDQDTVAAQVNSLLDAAVTPGSAMTPPPLTPVPPPPLSVLDAQDGEAAIAPSALLPGPVPTGIPAIVLAAYHTADDLERGQRPACGVPWWLLAGIGRIESGHAAGGRVSADGTTLGRIVGPRLDGSLPGTAVIPDTDRGALDGDPAFDRAVGPMQFLPGTWAGYAADGNADRSTDPNNVYDAAFGAAHYLCTAGGDLTTTAGLRRAVLAYNNSESYLRDVLAWGLAYRDGAVTVPDAPGPIPVVTTPRSSERPRRPGPGAPALPAPAAPAPTEGPHLPPVWTLPPAPTTAPTTDPGTDPTTAPCPSTDPAPSSTTPTDPTTSTTGTPTSDPVGTEPATTAPTVTGPTTTDPATTDPATTTSPSPGSTSSTSAPTVPGTTCP